MTINPIPQITPSHVVGSAALEFKALFTSIKIAVLAVEIIAIAFLFLGLADLAAILAIHLGLGMLLICAIVILEATGYGASALQSFTFQMLVAGPLGSASALIGEQLVKRTKPEMLLNWYETIAPAPQAAVTLADRIIDDQLVRPEAKLPKSIDALISRGSMREKQALFASIVSEGRIEGVNLIEKALRSRDQRVRVQAAAVSAYIRSRLRRSASTLRVKSSSAPVNAADIERNTPVA
jgi:hypothetical protein